MPTALDAETFSDLVGSIYDSAVDPGHWPATLTAVSHALDLNNGALNLFDMPNLRPLLNIETGVPPDYAGKVTEYMPEVAVLWNGILFNTDRPLDEPAVAMQERPELYRSLDVFREWAQPQGLCDLMGLSMIRSPDRVAGVGFGRHERFGLIGEREVAGVRQLAPHLRRAVTISDLLETVTIAAANFEALLDALSIGVALVDGRGQVVHANSACHTLLSARGAVRLEHGALHARQPQADAALSRAIGLAAHGDTVIGAAGIGLPAATSNGAAVVAYVLPLSSSAASGSGSRAWVRGSVAGVFLTHKEFPATIPTEVLMALFDLTPAEARVLAKLVQGGSPAKVAAELGIAELTVRTHLERLFGKTGTHRQSDLIGMVAGLRPPVATE